MSRIDNLKPFRPGQSGNPKGRPKGTVGLTNILREAINKDGNYTIVAGELLDEKNEPTCTMVKIKVKYSTAQSIVSTVLNLAKKGNMRAIEFVFNRLDGKPVEIANDPVDFWADFTDEELVRMKETMREATKI